MSLSVDALSATETRLRLLRDYAEHFETGRVFVGLTKDRAAHVAAGLYRGQDYWIAPQIVTALREAEKTLPSTIPLRLYDLPTPTGFAYLGKPWPLPIGRIATQSEPSIARALGWGLCQNASCPIHGAEGHVYIDCYGHPRQGEELLWLHSVSWQIGEALDDPAYSTRVSLRIEDGARLQATTEYHDSAVLADADLVPDDAVIAIEDAFTGTDRAVVSARDARTWSYLYSLTLRSIAYSLWAFSSQRIAQTSRYRLDRHDQKRWERFREPGEPEPNITVVSLRRIDYHHRPSEADEARRHYRRHAVSGHWAHRWITRPSHPQFDPTGPERQLVPVWIDPFVRGSGPGLLSPAKILAVHR